MTSREQLIGTSSKRRTPQIALFIITLVLFSFAVNTLRTYKAPIKKVQRPKPIPHKSSSTQRVQAKTHSETPSKPSPQVDPNRVYPQPMTMEVKDPFWEVFPNITEGQDCAADFRWFRPEEGRKRTAISSFPGSGNTWARHLLHMASGYWTGNRRGSNKLEAAGWKAEKNDCKDRTTIAQKTHRLHNNQACEFEQGIILVRNPFDAILAAYNHHKAGKTGEPPMTVYEGPDWPEFVDHWAYRWEEFHLQWLAFDGPVEWTCFQTLIKDPVETAGKWLDFLEMDHRRLGCIHADPTGQFQRKKTQDYSHLYTPKMAKYVHQKIKTISDGFKQKGIEDCTQYFKYDKCC